MTYGHLVYCLLLYKIRAISVKNFFKFFQYDVQQNTLGDGLTI
jgi:hypothetical protein